MNQLLTLKNNNRILTETRGHRQQTQCTDNTSFKFVFTGNENYRVGNRDLSIYPDSFLLLNNGTQYTSKIESDRPVELLSISYDKNFLRDFNRVHTCPVMALLDDPNSDNYKAPIFNETIYPLSADMRCTLTHLKNHLNNGTKDEMLINEYLQHSLINYYRIYNTEIFDKAERLHFATRTTRMEILKRLTLAKDYMCSNYNQNISLEELGKQSCLSVSHLLRTFKQAYNLSPHQYLMQLRLQRSRILLKTTDDAINDIVCMVGFNCPSSFIRLFKSRYKITPQKYRQTNPNNLLVN